jgi:hypothetical protein
MRKHFRVPPFAKNAKDGAPILLVMPAKSKACAAADQKHGPPAPPLVWNVCWLLSLAAMLVDLQSRNEQAEEQT